MKHDDAGISEITDEILMIGLLVALAIIIFAVSFGLFGFLQKSAYVVPDFSFTNVSGQSVVAVFHRAGDPVYFSNVPTNSYQAGFYVDTISGSFPALPDSSLTTFVPGDTVYIYYTGSGYAAAKDLTGISVSTPPDIILNVRLIDENNHVLIAQMNETAGPAGSLAGTTANMTANTTAAVTATITTTAIPTTNVTINVTTAATTAAATTSVYYPVAVSWTPKGVSGSNPYGSITPPGTNGGTVLVAAGGSQTFTFTPGSGHRIRAVFLDGAQVNSGGLVNQAITYTISNVHASHTLTAHFL